jgi:ribose 5-phosphate isomerase B
MKIAVAGDHAGFVLKRSIADALTKDGHQVVDLGAFDETPSDYPDFARALGESVASGETERGILICGSGIGACVAANKIKGIRAGIAHDIYSSHQGVEHDDMNVLCLGSRVIGPAPAIEIAKSFVMARFTNEERHLKRLRKVKEMEGRGEGG